MKRNIWVLLGAALLAGGLWGQDSGGVAGSAQAQDSSSAGNEGNAKTPGGAQQAIALDAQFRLLSDLTQEHRKKAESLLTNEPEKAKWESELAAELSTRASTLLAQIDDLAKQKAVSSSNDEVLFLAKVEDRLTQVHQDLTAALETGKLYAAQLQTNHISDEYLKLTGLVQENAFQVRLLQKEQSDLELKQLEFRALRKK